MANRWAGGVAITDRSRRPLRGQVERARDRRRGQCQHVHLRAQTLQLLLLAHAETVLLVDDDEAKTFETKRLGEQAVRADHDIHATARKPFGDGLDVAVVAQARDHFHGHRPIGEPIGECLEVLLREQRCRCQHGHLATTGDCEKGCAHGDLGLAEADVAADQAVGGLGTGEILDHGIDSGVLVGRGLERELLHEASIVVVRALERVARRGLPARVDVEEFGGDVPGLLGGTPLRLGPLVGAEPV